jgi:hypothetical protein
VTFLRQSALLLPSAFLLGVLLFLLTHPHNDPGFGNYPFFDQWAGSRVAAASPELRFLLQSLLFFLPGYAVSLLFLFGIVLAETTLFGRREQRSLSGYARAFGPAFAVLFLVASAAIVFEGERVAARLAPGALVAPVLVGFAPFAAAVLAALPAALVAAPIAAAQRRNAA